MKCLYCMHTFYRNKLISKNLNEKYGFKLNSIFLSVTIKHGSTNRLSWHLLENINNEVSKQKRLLEINYKRVLSYASCVISSYEYISMLIQPCGGIKLTI
jgi:hypothetical protein